MEQYLLEARNWIKDCSWLDLDSYQVDGLTDSEVIAGINRHYCGGMKAFLVAIA